MVHLSDVSMSNGRDLEQRFVYDKTYVSNRNSHTWMCKHRVISSDFTVWKTLLKSIYPIGNYLLHYTFNNWLNDGDLLQHWYWYTSK